MEGDAYSRGALIKFWPIGGVLIQGDAYLRGGGALIIFKSLCCTNGIGRHFHWSTGAGSFVYNN